MKSSVADALLSFSRARIRPPCSTTNQREASLGACFIATGESKVRFLKTRGVDRLGLQPSEGGGVPPPPSLTRPVPLLPLPPPQATSADATANCNRIRTCMGATLLRRGRTGKADCG